MSKAWKAAEEWFCQQLGGDRRKGGYQGNKGQNDCDDDVRLWSVEVKNWKRPTWNAMITDANKAVEKKKPGQFGIGVMHKKYADRETGTLVYLTWGEFMNLVRYMQDGVGEDRSLRDAMIDMRAFIDKQLGLEMDE